MGNQRVSPRHLPHCPPERRPGGLHIPTHKHTHTHSRRPRGSHNALPWVSPPGVPARNHPGRSAQGKPLSIHRESSTGSPEGLNGPGSRGGSPGGVQRDSPRDSPSPRVHSRHPPGTSCVCLCLRDCVCAACVPRVCRERAARCFASPEMAFQTPAALDPLPSHEYSSQCLAQRAHPTI